MKTSKRAIKTITAASGDNWRVEFRRNEGYTLIVNEAPCGGFDRLEDALQAREARRQHASETARWTMSQVAA